MPGDLGAVRSAPHLPLHTMPPPEHSVRSVSPVPEDYQSDRDGVVFSAEIDDIRLKRAEVTLRYEQKVEYLKAMLRGAEIREKLSRRKKGT